ncbi:hypothetical protein D3C85_1848030 [compost metagenome]
MPSVMLATPIWPADSVMWRTSRPRPKKPTKAGTRPSIKPSEIFDAKPEMFLRRNWAQRSARATPRNSVMRGL